MSNWKKKRQPNSYSDFRKIARSAAEKGQATYTETENGFTAHNAKGGIYVKQHNGNMQTSLSKKVAHIFKRMGILSAIFVMVAVAAKVAGLY